MYIYSCINLCLMYFSSLPSLNWRTEALCPDELCVSFLCIDNHAIEKLVDMENPRLPAEGAKLVQPEEKAEPPQIKGPVDLPERKEEEAQLDRPGAGK